MRCMMDHSSPKINQAHQLSVWSTLDQAFELLKHPTRLRGRKVPMSRTCAGVVVIAILGGCGTTIRYAPTNPAPRAMVARAPATVEVFTVQRPAQPFVEVGLLEAEQASELSTDDSTTVLAKLREKAGEIGCDGIILTDRTDRVVSAQHQQYEGSSLSHTSVNRLQGYRAACIVYQPGEAAKGAVVGGLRRARSSGR